MSHRLNISDRARSGQHAHKKPAPKVGAGFDWLRCSFAYFADLTSTNVATLLRSLIACGVATIVALAPLISSGCTLFGRLVQMHPPRRLGSSMKFALRVAMGLATALSWRNSRSRVLRAESRLMFLLTVTRIVCPGLSSNAICNL